MHLQGYCIFIYFTCNIAFMKNQKSITLNHEGRFIQATIEEYLTPPLLFLIVKPSTDHNEIGEEIIVQILDDYFYVRSSTLKTRFPKTSKNLISTLTEAGYLNQIN